MKLRAFKKCSLRWSMLNIFHDTRFRPLGSGWIIRPRFCANIFMFSLLTCRCGGNLTSCPLFSILFLWRYSCLPFFIVLCTDLSYMAEILPIRPKTLHNQSMIFIGWSMSSSVTEGYHDWRGANGTINIKVARLPRHFYWEPGEAELVRGMHMHTSLFSLHSVHLLQTLPTSEKENNIPEASCSLKSQRGLYLGGRMSEYVSYNKLIQTAIL